MKQLPGAALTIVALITPAGAMEQMSTESVLRSIPDRVPGIRLETLERSGRTIQATFHDVSSNTPTTETGARSAPQVLRVMTIEEETEEAASLEARRLVLETSIAASRLEWKGMSLPVWGRDIAPGLPIPPLMLEGDGPEISRITARAGNVVIDVHAYPALGKLVLPILDDLLERLRQWPQIVEAQVSPILNYDPPRVPLSFKLRSSHRWS